jgi:hypothetical protein
MSTKPLGGLPPRVGGAPSVEDVLLEQAAMNATTNAAATAVRKPKRGKGWRRCSSGVIESLLL